MEKPIEIISSKRRMLVIATGMAIACAAFFLLTTVLTEGDNGGRETHPLAAFLFMLIFVFGLIFTAWFSCYQRKLILSDTHFRIESYWRKARVHEWSNLQSWGEGPGVFILQFDTGKPCHIDAGILRRDDVVKLRTILTTRFPGNQVDVLIGVEGDPHLKRK